MSVNINSVKVKNLLPLRDAVLVSDMQFDSRTLSSGIVLLNDNGTTAGIRPRWGRVYAIGPEHDLVRPGQWVCVAHGRWTRGITIDQGQGEITVRKIDPNDILLVSDNPPDSDDTMSDAIQASSKTR